MLIHNFSMFTLFYFMISRGKGDIKSSSCISASINQEVVFQLGLCSRRWAVLYHAAISYILQLFPEWERFPNVMVHITHILAFRSPAQRSKRELGVFGSWGQNTLQIPTAILISIIGVAKDVCWSLLSPPSHCIV